MRARFDGRRKARELDQPSMSAPPDPPAGELPAGSGTETDLESGDTARPRSGAAPGSALPLRSRERYERLGEHARGGIGTITLARDRELGRELAIKEIQVPGQSSVERFVREAQITMRLEHPSIVPVHDAGRWESGEPFYAMKLVAGRPLDDVIAGARTFEGLRSRWMTRWLCA